MRAWSTLVTVTSFALATSAFAFGDDATPDPIGSIQLAISSAPSPVGAGARAAAIGSAFIAVADDATSASWNPAGLLQLERPEFSIVGRFTHQDDSVPHSEFLVQTRDTTKDVDSPGTDAVGLNFVSAVVPFAWRGRNVVCSLNYHQTLSFDRALDIGTRQVDRVDPVEATSRMRLRQDGAVYAISPALAVEIDPSLSLGVSLNYWFDGIGRSYAWRIRSTDDTSFTLLGDTTTASYAQGATFDDLHGVTGTVGALWHPSREVALGAVAKAPFQANVTWSRFARSETTLSTDRMNVRIEYPFAAGAGVSWRPRDAWLVSFDATYVAWSDYRLIDAHDNAFLVSGDPVGAENEFRPPEATDEPRASDVTTLRLGLEYVVRLQNPAVTIRLGGSYDPEPSRGAAEPFYGVTGGAGLTFAEFSVDAAYELRFGQHAGGLAILRNVIEAPDASISTYQHDLSLSLVYYL